MDRPEVDVIFIEGYDEAGIGRALMDRMRRAAAAAEVDADALLAGELTPAELAKSGEARPW